jgi:WD40 repeat protein
VVTYKGHSNYVVSLAWSPDGKRIASGSYDDTVQVWDPTNPKATAYTYNGHTDNVYSISWSPDGRYIVSASSDKTVQVWQPK